MGASQLCGQDSTLPGWTDSPKLRLQRSREDSAAAPQPRPASRSSLLDAQPCCFSPGLYSDSELPSPDSPSPPTKDIRGVQVSAPSLCVWGVGMEWPTQASPALTLRSLGSLNIFF